MRMQLEHGRSSTLSSRFPLAPWPFVFGIVVHYMEAGGVLPLCSLRPTWLTLSLSRSTRCFLSSNAILTAWKMHQGGLLHG